MKRLAIITLFAACSDPESDPKGECHFTLRSRNTNLAAAIVSGREVIGVSWMEKIGLSAPDNHAALMFPDGTRSQDIRVGRRQVSGTSGKASVLWHAPHRGPECAEIEPFDVALQRADDVTHVQFGSTLSRTVAFDGTAYQVFWISAENGRVFHQSLGEDGALGAIHDLGTPAIGIQCVSAASDRAGTTFVRINGDGFLVDTANGTKQMIWSVSDQGLYQKSFYFAGKWHVPEHGALTSIAPDGTYARKILQNELRDAVDYRPGATTLYVSTTDAVVEVDPNLAPRQLYRRATELGTFGDDRVYFDQFSIDGENLIPAYIAVTRDGSTMWRVDVAKDSPLETVEECIEEPPPSR